MTITEFLTARLDDDEQVARAATRGPWVVHRQGVEAIVSPGVAMDREEGGVSVLDATHIARHDPERVLADVAMKKALLVMHDQSGTAWVGFPRADQKINYCRHDSHRAPCETVRLMASVYATHPDYWQEWAP